MFALVPRNFAKCSGRGDQDGVCSDTVFWRSSKPSTHPSPIEAPPHADVAIVLAGSIGQTAPRIALNLSEPTDRVLSGASFAPSWAERVVVIVASDDYRAAHWNIRKRVPAVGVPKRELRDAVNLIVVTGMGEAEKFGLKIGKPWCAQNPIVRDGQRRPVGPVAQVLRAPTPIAIKRCSVLDLPTGLRAIPTNTFFGHQVWVARASVRQIAQPPASTSIPPISRVDCHTDENPGYPVQRNDGLSRRMVATTIARALPAPRRRAGPAGRQRATRIDPVQCRGGQAFSPVLYMMPVETG